MKKPAADRLLQFQFQLGRPVRRPWVPCEIRMRDFLALVPQENEKSGDIKGVPHRCVRREILLRELKESHRRLQASAVLWMSWLLEVFLEMNESARCLNQTFKEIRVR